MSATSTSAAANADALFTCKSCAVAFQSSDSQRDHFRSDFHRYNMQRRVAGLVPLDMNDYNSKVLERRAEGVNAQTVKDWNCLSCRKTYTTENAYLSHLNSKRHRENETKPMFQRAPTGAAASIPSTLNIPDDADEETVTAIIDARIAAAEAQLQPTMCLFCPHASAENDVSSTLSHMHNTHSFFVPDAEHLDDLPGLLVYLTTKIVIAQVCIYCAREFRTVDAVRKHMTDKSHSKIPFETAADRRELAAFYQFSRHTKALIADDDGSDSAEDPPDSSHDASASDLDSDNGAPAYDDHGYELVLRDGQRIGHRSLARYFKQRFTPVPVAPEDSQSGPALVRALVKDKNSALVPVRGGFGAFGAGTEVVKARNAGEARHAGEHIRLHRDQNRREEFRTRVAFIANHQKHYRDPILGKTGS